VADDPDGARHEVDEAMARWPATGFHAQHSWELYARGEIGLYEGRGAETLAYVQDRWPALKRSMLLRIQGARVESIYLRARAALAAAMDPRATAAVRRSALRLASADARRLGGESAAWSRAAALVVTAGLATIRGDRRGAADRYRAAEAAFQSADMAFHTTVVRRRRGQIIGGLEGSALVGAADEWMRAQGIRNPARMTDVLAPAAAAPDTAL